MIPLLAFLLFFAIVVAVVAFAIAVRALEDRDARRGISEEAWAESQERLERAMAAVAADATRLASETRTEALAVLTAHLAAERDERKFLVRALVANGVKDLATLERIEAQVKRVEKGDTIDGDPRRHLTPEEYQAMLAADLVGMGYPNDVVSAAPGLPDGI